MNSDGGRRRHRRKTPAEIALEARAIAAGGPVPDSRIPNREAARYEQRIEALQRACPTCGAPPHQSCASARPGTLRWSFHRARWRKPMAGEVLD